MSKAAKAKAPASVKQITLTANRESVRNFLKQTVVFLKPLIDLKTGKVKAGPKNSHSCVGVNFNPTENMGEKGFYQLELPEGFFGVSLGYDRENAGTFSGQYRFFCALFLTQNPASKLTQDAGFPVHELCSSLEKYKKGGKFSLGRYSFEVVP